MRSALYPLIIHKMGSKLILLTADRIAFGVDCLLKSVADRAAVELQRPPAPPGGGQAFHTVVSKEFLDGVAFQLDISSKLPAVTPSSSDPVISRVLASLTAPPRDPASQRDELGLDMVWSGTELPPEELLFPATDGFNTGLEEFFKTSKSWVLRVSVCEGCYQWVAPKWNPELRSVRSVLDAYALPRIIVPTQGAERYRDDFILLIALFAAKAQCLAIADELPLLFRSYCDCFFDSQRKCRKLSEADWHGVIDRVFERLYGGKVGKGFTMPVYPLSFRAYVRQAIRGGVQGTASTSQRIRRAGRFPLSINEAANTLRVSHMTVRRWMGRLHFAEWTEEAWKAVAAKVMPRKQWRELTVELQRSGLQRDAARKRVQGYKAMGLTPDEARRESSIQVRKGTCAACAEEQVPGELHEGKFYCADCYKEKTGIRIEE